MLRQRISRKLAILIYCFFGSLLFLIFQGGKVALMLFLVISVLSIYLLMGKWSGITSARGTREIIHPVFFDDMEAGTSLKIEINVHIPGFWPFPYVIVRESLIRKDSDPLYYNMTFVPDWNRKGKMVYTIPPLRRGHYKFGKTVCSTEDVFGLFEHKGTMNLEQSFRILPTTVEIKHWHHLHEMLKGAHHHSAAIRAHRETTQIDGVRDYVYGDRLSRIHWKSSARTGVWKSKEFERESLPKMTIILDRNASDYDNDEQFEKAVSTTASLLRFAHREQLAIGLLSVGKETTYYEASRGFEHQRKIMTHLIDVESDGQRSLGEIVHKHQSLIGTGGFTLLVTPQQHVTHVVQMLDLLSQAHMIPCLMWIAGEEHADGQSTYSQLFKILAAKGYYSYGIHQLADLPQMLGGRMP